MLSLFALAMAGWPFFAPPEPALTPEAFAAPAANTRILKIIHGWPDDPKAQDARIAQLKAQGFGGAVCNVAFDGYLENETKWQSFLRAVRRMKEEGFALWLYDEKGYPSGTAGGIVLRDHPEWAARGLLIADAIADGGQALSIEQPPGSLLFAKAFPLHDGQIALNEAIDLSGSIAARKLTWTAPAGRWHAMIFSEDAIFEGTHAALNVYAKQSYVNLLLPEPIARFLELTHDAYAKRLGPDLGAIFEATFTDEPSLMSCFLRPMPWRVAAWSQTLPAEFERRRGYDLLPMLPALAAPAGPAGERFRRDFWQTVGELVSDNFFGQIQRRCAQYHIPSGGHLLIEESTAAHVPFYGDFFRCLRKLDAPSIDCLTSLPEQVPWQIARLARSAADLEDKTLVMCEVSDHSQRYRPPGDTRPKRQVTETEIRGTLNRLFAGGINVITSYYSFDGLDEASIRRLNDWTGRCCALLRGTRPAARIALLYPAESLQVRTFASRHSAKDSPGALKIQERFLAASDMLFAHRREFTIVDSQTLVDARVASGGLRRCQSNWDIVVLPETATLPLAAWRKLRVLAEAGGVVIALGARPTNAGADFPSPEADAIALALFGPPSDAPVSRPAGRSGGGGVFLPSGNENLLPFVVDGLLAPDVAFENPAPECRIALRRSNDQALLFVMNDCPESWTGSIRLRGVASLPEQLSPASGKISPLAGQPPQAGQTDEWTTPPLSIEPYGATVLRFKQADRTRLRPLQASVLPGLQIRDLPSPAPTTGKGPVVETALHPIPPAGPASPGRWRSVSTLSKGDVDSWLFLRFQFPKPVDLSSAVSLVIDCEMPAGQTSPAQFFAYLHEEDGSSYIAPVGRSGADSSRRSSHVALDRFRPFTSAKTSNGRLDPERIAAISVGWGGYTGVAGERIEFTVAPPRAAFLEPNTSNRNKPESPVP